MEELRQGESSSTGLSNVMEEIDQISPMSETDHINQVGATSGVATATDNLELGVAATIGSNEMNLILEAQETPVTTDSQFSSPEVEDIFLDQSSSSISYMNERNLEQTKPSNQTQQLNTLDAWLVSKTPSQSYVAQDLFKVWPSSTTDQMSAEVSTFTGSNAKMDPTKISNVTTVPTSSTDSTFKVTTRMDEILAVASTSGLSNITGVMSRVGSTSETEKIQKAAPTSESANVTDNLELVVTPTLASNEMNLILESQEMPVTTDRDFTSLEVEDCSLNQRNLGETEPSSKTQQLNTLQASTKPSQTIAVRNLFYYFPPLTVPSLTEPVVTNQMPTEASTSRMGKVSQVVLSSELLNVTVEMSKTDKVGSMAHTEKIKEVSPTSEGETGTSMSELVVSSTLGSPEMDFILEAEEREKLPLSKSSFNQSISSTSHTNKRNFEQTEPSSKTQQLNAIKASLVSKIPSQTIVVPNLFYYFPPLTAPSLTESIVTNQMSAEASTSRMGKVTQVVSSSELLNVTVEMSKTDKVGSMARTEKIKEVAPTSERETGTSMSELVVSPTLGSPEMDFILEAEEREKLPLSKSSFNQSSSSTSHTNKRNFEQTEPSSKTQQVNKLKESLVSKKPSQTIIGPNLFYYFPPLTVPSLTESIVTSQISAEASTSTGSKVIREPILFLVPSTSNVASASPSKDSTFKDISRMKETSQVASTSGLLNETLKMPTTHKINEVGSKSETVQINQVESMAHTEKINEVSPTSEGQTGTSMSELVVAKTFPSSGMDFISEVEEREKLQLSKSETRVTPDRVEDCPNKSTSSTNLEQTGSNVKNERTILPKGSPSSSKAQLESVIANSKCATSTSQNANKIRCVICPNLYVSNIKQHYFKKHPSARTICDHRGCATQCKDIKELEQHKKTAHPKTGSCESVCDICSQKFHNQVDLKTHYLISHPEITIICNYQYCAKIFKNKATLDEHQKSHPGWRTRRTYSWAKSKP